jgi:hypothetical protein
MQKESGTNRIQKLKQKWIEHLDRNNMTYREHWTFAVSHGLGCLRAGMYLIIHGFLPCFYEKTGSKLVHELEKDFVERENVINT